jgi:hypothetical protein
MKKQQSGDTSASACRGTDNMAATKKDNATKANPDFTLKKSQMLEALEKSLGVVTTAAKKVGISRRQHYNWLKSDQAYCDAVADINNLSLDLAESKLFNAVNNGELSAIIFLLKCKGKKRGYIERPADEPAPQDHNKPEICMRPARLAESDED